MQVKIEITFDVPADASLNEVDEWVKFQVGKTCYLTGKNKMANFSIDELGATTKISVSEV